jgi:hypothetical protein
MRRDVWAQTIYELSLFSAVFATIIYNIVHIAINVTSCIVLVLYSGLTQMTATFRYMYCDSFDSNLFKLSIL